MMNIPSVLLAVALVSLLRPASAVEKDVVTLHFDSRFAVSGELDDVTAPAWIAHIEQQNGTFLDEPRCWHAPASLPEGAGRLGIALDRSKMNWDLAATLVFDADEAGDVAVQLFDAQGRVVVVDLFGNLVDVGAEATTDTFIVPLKKYPTAQKIVIRRIKGDVKLYGLALYPVVTEGVPIKEELEKLARSLGDPFSPENPLSAPVANIAKTGKIDLDTTKADAKAGDEKDAATPEKRVQYSAAVPAKSGGPVLPLPTAGLVAHWSFDGDASDATGHGHNGRIRGGATFANGLFGRALSLRKNPTDDREREWDAVTLPPGPVLALPETLTVAGWVKFNSIAPYWGSQIAWFGDSHFGCDPWNLQVLPDGTLQVRSDRSVTGQPRFAVFEDEIRLLPGGRPVMTQRVAAWSPGTLTPGNWYFVAGSIGTDGRESVLRLYINAARVAETRTFEKVNYPVEKMWMAVGAVDSGGWQNFDGLIDELRLYGRALTDEEIAALYRQPRR